MPIDTSMYSQMQSPDILGGIEKGMRLGDLIQNRKLKDQELAEKQKIKDAYKQGVVTNPDGTTSIDDAKTLSALAGISPMEAKEYQRKMLQDRATQFDMHTKENELIARIAPNIKDQPTYEEGLKYLSAQGVDVSKMPQQYDPGLVSNHARSSQAWLDQNWREIEAKRDQGNKDRTHRLQERELGLKRDQILADKSGAGKPPTGDQSKAATFAHRISSAERVMEDLSQQGFDGADRRTWVQKNLIGEAKPVNLQKLEQAQRNFINATLRRESGAAIADSEFDNAKQQYFPQPGDSPEVLEQKRQNRLDVMAGLRAEAGNVALGNVAEKREAVGQQYPKPEMNRTEAPAAPKHGTVESGYVFMGGDPANPKSWKLASKTASRVRTEKE